MLCKVCKEEVPKKGGLVVLSADMLRGKSLVIYEDHEPSEVNDLVCGKPCALEFMSRKIDEVLQVKDAFNFQKTGTAPVGPKEAA